MAYLDREDTARAVWWTSGLVVASGVFGVLGFTVPDPRVGAAMALPAALCLAAFVTSARRLTRCPRCRGSALWWSATHTERGPFPLAVFRLEACPYCGYEGSA